MKSTRDAPFRDDVQCFVEKLEYDFVEREGRLVMSGISCTDMSGCIGLFKKIDPEVRIIRTFRGDVPDTQYRIMNDTWRSLIG